jgi:uncharacterized protein YcfJ
MKKSVLTILPLAMGIATAAVAKEKINVGDVVVYDHTTTVVTQIPSTQTRCQNIKVPIYENVQTQGDAAGGALAGMIIGGILGKGISGKDDGAAAGAVLGGIIGADKGSRPKTQQRIAGYETQRQCSEIVVYTDQPQERYSHSTIRFYLNGKRYVLDFIK